MIPTADYDPALDAAGSYDAAIAAKQKRGDIGYPLKWPADAVQRVSIKTLVPYPTNARTHSAGQIDQIAASIRQWGWTVPVLVDVSNTVIAGHGRLEAAKLLGLDTVPVMVAKGWTQRQIKAYRLADNQLALNAAWDVKLLAAELGELTDMAELIGFSDDELLKILGNRQGLTDPDEAPPLPEEPTTKRGDLWVCGKHRVLCGDATNAEDVARLLGEVKPNLMVTDPPYGVDFDPTWRKGSETRTYMGDKPDKEFVWREVWELFPGDVAYIWFASNRIVPIVHCLEELGFEYRALIIWYKDRFVIGRGHYNWNHEPCFYGVRKNGRSDWQGARDQPTVWTISHRASDTNHGAQKPVECMRRPILNNSSVGQAVYDPFVGSGTTMIAAEMEGRAAFAMDISEGYVDVAVRRWEAFTGETAERHPANT